MRKKLKRIKIEQSKRRQKERCKKSRSRKRSKLRSIRKKNWKLRRSWPMLISVIFQIMVANKMMRIDT
jgi:hypothetical protein